MTEALSYATPEFQTTKPSTVGFLLGVLGLGLIFLSGCFMIGIMLVQFSPGGPGMPTHGSPASRLLFLSLLYLFAIATFVGGAIVMVSGVRKLLLN